MRSLMIVTLALGIVIGTTAVRAAEKETVEATNPLVALGRGVSLSAFVWSKYESWERLKKISRFRRDLLDEVERVLYRHRLPFHSKAHDSDAVLHLAVGIIDEPLQPMVGWYVQLKAIRAGSTTFPESVIQRIRDAMGEHAPKEYGKVRATALLWQDSNGGMAAKTRIDTAIRDAVGDIVLDFARDWSVHRAQIDRELQKAKAELQALPEDRPGR